jgi:hypothetical protein
MTYEFECRETGEKIERDFLMAEKPAEIIEDGKVYKTVFGMPRVHMPLGFTTRNGRQISTPIRAKKPLHGKLFY